MALAVAAHRVKFIAWALPTKLGQGVVVLAAAAGSVIRRVIGFEKFIANHLPTRQ